MDFFNTYITGMGQFGKTTLMHHKIIEDITEGHGLFYIDPHGNDILNILDRIPDHRRDEVIYYDPTGKLPIAMNPLANVPEDDWALVASALADTTRSVAGYDGIATPNITNNVFFVAYALMAAGATLVDLPRLLGNSTHTIPRTSASGKAKKPKVVLYREHVLDKLKDKLDDFHKDYWTQFADLAGKERREYTASTRSQFYILFGDPRIRKSFNQRQASFTFKHVLENNLIFLARLPQGRLGIDRTKALGSLLIAQLYLAMLDRERRAPFTLAFDDLEHWSAPLMVRLANDAQRYGCRMLAANRYREQLDRHLFAVLRGNFPVRHVFRLSKEDAEIFSTDLGEMTSATALDELPRFTYRTFPFREGTADDIVPPLDPVTYPENRKAIESNMWRNYVKGGK